MENIHRVEHVPGFGDIQDSFHARLPEILEGKDTFAWPEPEDCMIANILSAVSSVSKVPVADIKGVDRRHEFIIPRFVAIKLAREFTNKSLANIGRHFGNRDHTSIVHAIKQVDYRIEADWNGSDLYNSFYARAKAML